MTELINLLLSCTDPVVIGSVINVPIQVYTNEIPQRIVACDVLFSWDPSKLKLLGIDNTGGLEAQMSFLPSPPQWDFYGINETMPPSDGSGLYYWLSPLNGIPYYISTEPVTLTTLQFEVLPDFTPTTVEFIPTLTVFNTANTVVYGTDIPGFSVTGLLTGTTVTGIPGDFDYDGLVGSKDMAQLLGNWGLSFTDNQYDLNQDGKVDSGDLAILLGNWS